VSEQLLGLGNFVVMYLMSDSDFMKWIRDMFVG
jgi:hypothetical protein